MLLLASASPRRRDLLTQSGFSFRVVSVPIPEILRPDEDAIQYVQRLAREKAEAVFQAPSHPAFEAIKSEPGPFMILGADTTVVCDREILGKPVDDADAVRMLRLLSGRTHQVITGVCLISQSRYQPDAPRNSEIASASTHVTMLTLSDQDIRSYVASGEPMDKAGAYAIQGYAARWISRISGCYFNVVGLPISLVHTMVEAARHQLS